MENQKQTQNPDIQDSDNQLAGSVFKDQVIVLEKRENNSTDIRITRNSVLKENTQFLDPVIKEDQSNLSRTPKIYRNRLSSLQPNYRITERDLEILKFINDFGFVEMPHLDRRFGFKKPRNYQLITKLVDAGFVQHERVFFGRHGVYRLTPKGAAMTELPHLARINLGTYKHDIVLIDTYLNLRMQYPEAGWISERQLMKDKHATGVGQRGHVPDGLLVFPDGKQVAIEVELTLKGKYRLEKILKGYGAAFSYKEVWYYCSRAIIDSMRSMAVKMPFIKFYELPG